MAGKKRFIIVKNISFRELINISGLANIAEPEMFILVVFCISVAHWLAGAVIVQDPSTL